MGAERMRQVNELLRQHISEILVREMELPLDSFVTVTRVETSRDLKHATVYVMILPDNRRVSTLRALTKHLGALQRLLGPRLKMKFTPRLKFTLDEQEIKAQQVYTVLDTPPETPEKPDEN